MFLPALCKLSLLVWLMLSISFLLHGCGSGSSEKSERFTGISLPKRKGNGPTTIIVMRHCGRSESDNNIRTSLLSFFGLGGANVNEYSAEAWPKFPVAAYNCLERGSELIEAQGVWYSKEGGLPQPVRGIADTAERNIESMTRFVKGFGSISSMVDHSPYEPASTSACKDAKPGTTEWKQNAMFHMEQNPPPEGYAKYKEMLSAAMGKGEDDWLHDGCRWNALLGDDFPPYPYGTCQAAGNFAARMLAEYIGGMEVLWDKVKAIDIPKLMNLHSWHFFLWWGPELTARYFGASIARAIADELVEGEKGTTIYFGHDSDIMMLKSLLGVSWDPMPFAAINDTSPGSMLRFDLKDDKVNISFWHVKNFSDADGAMRSIPVAAGLQVSEVFHSFRNGPLAACGNPAPKSEPVELAVSNVITDRLEDIRRENFSVNPLTFLAQLHTGLFACGASILLTCTLICRQRIRSQRTDAAHGVYTSLLDGA